MRLASTLDVIFKATLQRLIGQKSVILFAPLLLGISTVVVTFHFFVKATRLEEKQDLSQEGTLNSIPFLLKKDSREVVGSWGLGGMHVKKGRSNIFKSLGFRV